jgi:hypothetical protein
MKLRAPRGDSSRGIEGLPEVLVRQAEQVDSQLGVRAARREVRRRAASELLVHRSSGIRPEAGIDEDPDRGENDSKRGGKCSREPYPDRQSHPSSRKR